MLSTCRHASSDSARTPKLSCTQCETIVQSPAPSRRSRADGRTGSLGHVLVSKYADHLPLYRQAQIYEREGSNWIARPWLTGGRSQPLVDPLIAYWQLRERSSEAAR